MPVGVAVDRNYIYYANNDGGTIGRADLDGTNLNQDFITTATGPLGLAVDGSAVYWAIGAALAPSARANLDGNPSSVNQNFITGACQRLVGVAVDAAHIYWTN